MHPDDGKPIVANFGPYSPYVKHNTDFRSLDSEAAVFEVTLDQAVELFRQPKQSRRQSVSRTVLNALGARPGTEKAMQVLSGRYGPYVTDGTTHASLPKSADPAKITIAEAEELLKAREAMGPPQKKGARKGAGGRAASSGPQERASQGRLIGDSMEPVVQIVGAGLAGSEAAWQVASRGVRVVLHEMRPAKPTAVHKTAGCAELVCSNSFRGDKLDNAVGLLKEEMRRLGSLIMQSAETARVPAGAALAVDRDRFSAEVTDGARGAPADLDRPRRGAGHPAAARRRRPRDHRHRAADVGRAVRGPGAHRRRRAPLLLRRDQPDRPRRIDRPQQGVPRLALGSIAARTRLRRRAGRRGGRRAGYGGIGRRRRRAAAPTTDRATI